MSTVWRRRLVLLSAVAAGGGIGACARYATIEAWRAPVDVFDWPIFVINVVGCVLIGCVTQVCAYRGWRTLQAFAGVGVLGGFTTFSGYAVHLHAALSTDLLGALAYLFATPIAALAATGAGLAATSAALRRWSGSNDARVAS